MRNCLADEGRSLGTGLQEQVPNHLRRLWSKAMVVSAGGKGLARTRSGGWQEEDRKGTTDDVSKAKGRCQNRNRLLIAGQSFGVTCLRTKRHPAYRGLDLAAEAEMRNVGTWSFDANGEATSGRTTRARVRKRSPGADCSVGAMRRGNARGAKGAGHPR